MSEFKIADTGHLSHAYLISAPSMDIALAAANRLAATAVCTAPQGKPCGVCRGCHKVAENIHPDVITIGRLVDDKGKLKREISVEQIRRLSSDACIMPNEAVRKVYIIREAETMNLNAQNAALKLLEEPPLGALFLLCTTNSSQLLPTVRSRCVELNYTGSQVPADKALSDSAAAYLKAVSTGDRAKLYSWCSSNDGMDLRDTTAFVDCAMELVGDTLCGRRDSMGLSISQLQQLYSLLERCAAYLRHNVGSKHIFGLLAVDSIADIRNRG